VSPASAITSSIDTASKPWRARRLFSRSGLFSA
jgi:hypothetical protein